MATAAFAPCHSGIRSALPTMRAELRESGPRAPPRGRGSRSGWYSAAALIFLLLLCETATGSLTTDAAAYEWDGTHFSVPLTVRDNSGHDRHGWPVTMGVPLPRGVVHDTAELRVLDERGNTIPTQFEVLSRHYARDGSIRWVLLDFQMDLPAGGETRVRLTNKGNAPAIPDPLRVRETADRIEVDTGPLRATVPASGDELFARVEIGGRTVIADGPGDGTYLRSGDVPAMERFHGPSWNTHGWNKQRGIVEHPVAEASYRGRNERAYVETRGPLRTVIRIDGRHMPEEAGAGIVEEGMYGYTVRLHFYHDKPFVTVQYDLANSDTEAPLWSYLYREAGLEHSLDLASPVRVSAGGLEADGGPPATGGVETSPGNAVWLYQHEPEIVRPERGRPHVEVGRYRFGPGSNGEVARPVAGGHQARFLDVSDGAKGVMVAMRYFWREAPRAIGTDGRRLRVRVHAGAPGHRAPPDGQRPEYDLDFGERSIHDLLYLFHTGTFDDAAAAAVAEAFEYPLAAHAPPAWYADSGAWYFEVSREPGSGWRDADTDEHWHPDLAGPGRHGYNRSYNSGGHHESLNSGWLSYIRSGRLADWERNLVLSRWSVARNPGWAYRDNVLAFGEGDDRLTALDGQLREWDRLTAFGPKDFYLWRSGETYIDETPRGEVERPYGGKSYLNMYKWLPDHEHYALFRLFEYYYLTGDRRALDAIHGFVNWAVNFQHRHLFGGRTRPLEDTDYLRRHPDAMRRGHYARVYSWMLYTSLAGLHATGSEVFDLYTRWQVRRALALLRHRHGQFTRWQPDRFETDPQGRRIHRSRVQSWMEAQGVLALHEAYRTFGDERILDGIWAQADYFAHHVLFFPRLMMFNNRTSMPHQRLGTGKGRGSSLTPLDHDRYIQAMPLLYHYTGWPAVRERHDVMMERAAGTWVRDWFLQTSYWQREQHPKHSDTPPEAITDLEVLRTDRSGIELRWTSPADDGPAGRAARYFVKYSDKPIVEFAPADNPVRAEAMERIRRQAEDLVLERMGDRKKPMRRHRTFAPGDTDTEPEPEMLASPDWHEVDAFWMAEHVSGEPEPGPAGTEERFTVTELRPHNRFGLEETMPLEDLPAGTYHVAICAWDEDRNLSRLSNVVQVRIEQ